MPSLWTELLIIKPGLLAGILDSLDSLSLMAYALEFDDQATASIIREDSPLYPFNEMHVMRFAVVHSCFRAVYSLRDTRDVVYGDRRKNKAAPREKVLGGVISGSSPCNQSLMQWLGAPQTYPYRFLDEGVMHEAATLGDLDVIKWIHSGTTAYTSFLAVEHAARAGHLACAQWLAENAHSAEKLYSNSKGWGIQIDVVVSFDAELGIFAWCASNAEHLRTTIFQWNVSRSVHRSGFVFQGTDKQQCAVSLKTGS